MDRYNASQSATIDQDNRNMKLAGIPMSEQLNDLQRQIDASPVSITATGAAVDSLAKGDNTFSLDFDTADGSSLVVAWKASIFHNGLTLVSVAAGTLTLTASSTNYVEVDRSGTVSFNTSAFTSGRLPLYKVITGSGSWDPDTVVYSKPLLTLIGSVAGAQLSTAAATKEIASQLAAAISGSTSYLVLAPNAAATLIKAEFTNGANVSADNSNYWTFSLQNKGNTGTGVTDMLSTAAVNSTQLTGGAGLTQYAPRALTLHGTPGADANLDTAANDVLLFTVTKFGSATSLTLATLRLDFGFST